MTESFFSKIYSYRERENKNSKENFFIEILVYCLNTDKVFLNDFLDFFGIRTEAKVTIKSQPIYEFGRPDIEINIASINVCILVECKIEHFERTNQLEDYKKILLNKKNTKRHLVYLTKYYDFRENHEKKINFHLLKWVDIFSLINQKNRDITKEFKSLIKDENMSESKNFTYNDLAAIKNITGTIRKMDEVLDGIKEYYESKIGVLSKDSARSTRLKDQWYSTFQSFSDPLSHHFSVSFGFNWWWDNQIYIATRMYLSTADKYKKTDYYLKLFKRGLKNWEFEEFENCVTFTDYKPIAQFIIDESEQIPAMVAFLKQGVDKLESLKIIDPKIFD